MPRTKSWIAAIAAVGLIGAGCHSKPPVASAPPPPSTPPPAPTRTAPPPAPPARDTNRAAPSTPSPSDEELFRQKSLDELNREHPLGDAFFDLDKVTLRDDARSALAADATWLKRWSGTAILVQGHADERGTAEYNLALGQNRAKAVQDYLVSLGIPASRIRINSLGKDAPFCTGESESCWSQNRRGHFVITSK
jgi:peptidoglycan-associated lipoprotein